MSRVRAVVPRILAVVAVLALIGIAYHYGVFARLREPEQLARSLVELGAWGWLCFVVAYAVLQPFGVPGTVFVFAAPLIWPWHVAFGLSMTGTMAASVVGFSFARFVARDWVSKRIPARFSKYEAQLEARGFATVFLLRFVFWMPPLLHAFFGVSRVRFWTHFWGSLAGYLVPLLLVSVFGQRLFSWLKTAPASFWFSVLGAMVVSSGVSWGLRVRRRRATRANGA